VLVPDFGSGVGLLLAVRRVAGPGMPGCAPTPTTPGWSSFRVAGGLTEQDRAGVADQAGPAGGDLQGMVPPVMLHGQERSSPGIKACGNP
jgi:hypothetical protein